MSNSVFFMVGVFYGVLDNGDFGLRQPSGIAVGYAYFVPVAHGLVDFHLGAFVEDELVDTSAFGRAFDNGHGDGDNGAVVAVIPDAGRDGAGKAEEEQHGGDAAADERPFAPEVVVAEDEEDSECAEDCKEAEENDAPTGGAEPCHDVVSPLQEENLGQGGYLVLGLGVGEVEVFAGFGEAGVEAQGAFVVEDG